MKKNDKVTIHCYKHNGMLNKIWEEATVLDETDDYLVVGDDHVLVLRRDGRNWRTNEKAIIFFFKKNWFNVLVQFKNYGINYYCNIASPYIIDNNIIKYIDYDLDLKVYTNGNFQILDKNEYNYHKNVMNYSYEIDMIIKRELKELIKLKEEGITPFNKDENLNYYNVYNIVNNIKD